MTVSDTTIPNPSFPSPNTTTHFFPARLVNTSSWLAAWGAQIQNLRKILRKIFASRKNLARKIPAAKSAQNLRKIHAEIPPAKSTQNLRKIYAKSTQNPRRNPARPHKSHTAGETWARSRRACRQNTGPPATISKLLSNRLPLCKSVCTANL